LGAKFHIINIYPMFHKYFIAIPAYNEEKHIEEGLISINEARKEALPDFSLENTFICLNGCTDNTEKIVKNVILKMPELKIKILSSEKGMNRALNKIIDNINKEFPIIKVDADAICSKKSFYILLHELKKFPQLQIVGGYPRALPYIGKHWKNPYKTALSRILDIRSNWPESQIAVNDVRLFHKIADISSQPEVTPIFEKKSRIYFHGRFYIMRDKKVWDVPPESIGDDTYLTISTYQRFGLNSIRIRYDAFCYYQPTTSFIAHWKTYKRIHHDLKTIFDITVFKNMQYLKSFEKMKLNWPYINTLSTKIKVYFLCYSIIKLLENFLFQLFPKYSDKLWTYKKKN